MTTERWFVQDITQPIVVQHCEGVVFTADNNGNVIGVKLYKDGAAFNPSGTATCNVIRPDGVTVSFDGTVSGNAISATLPVTALAVPGVIGVVLQSISGSVVTTVFKGQFTCELTTTETVVAPSVPTSSLAQLTQDVIGLQNGKVNKSGDTMTGPLNLRSATVFSTGDGYARLYYKDTVSGANLAAFNLLVSNRRLFATEYSAGSSNVERFYFPAPDANRTADGNYDILTTKSPVTVAQGGTGLSGITSPTLTPGSNVAITANGLVRFGPMIALNFVVTVNSDLATGATIATIGNIDDTTGGPIAYLCAFRLDGTFKTFIKVKDSKNIISNAAIPAGIWYVNACIIV